MQANVPLAIHLPSLAIEVFKMQFDYSPTVEIGRKVMGGVRPHSAHVKNRISDFRREAIDMLWIPGLVMR